MDGVLLVDKPPGPSSHGVVAAVRGSLGARLGRRGRRQGPKVGHAGTLDPFASGLLLVLVGRATRVQSLLMGMPKSYEVVARLGATSTTGDPEGEITETGRMPADPPLLPRGEVRQRPPAYSAVKVDGERAYRRARRGEDVLLPERTITVHRFEQTWRDGDRAGFAVECSSGTYVRSLIADLGDAYCLSLRRTAIGPFSVADAVPPPAAGATTADAAPPLLSLEQALCFLPAVRLGPDCARRAGHGQALPLPPGFAPPLGEHAPVLLCDAEGVIAVARVEAAPDGQPLLRPRVGLRG